MSNIVNTILFLFVLISLKATLRSHFVKPTKMSLNNVVRVSSRAIVMDLRDVGVSDVLVSKIMFCVIADLTAV